jgi:hypothetical protein
MRPSLQHYLNPLHIFCRLRGIGLPKILAIFLCRTYERVFFNPFFKNSGKLVSEKAQSKEAVSNGSWLK